MPLDGHLKVRPDHWPGILQYLKAVNLSEYLSEVRSPSNITGSSIVPIEIYKQTADLSVSGFKLN